MEPWRGEFERDASTSSLDHSTDQGALFGYDGALLCSGLAGSHVANELAQLDRHVSWSSLSINDAKNKRGCSSKKKIRTESVVLAPNLEKKVSRTVSKSPSLKAGPSRVVMPEISSRVVEDF